jgi:hypothetical protein
MNKFYLLLFLLPQTVFCQNLSGQWTGQLTQNGKQDTFFYQLDLVQNGGTITGTAFSKSKEVIAKFEIGGLWDGTTLAIQEVQQLEPPGAKWCLKHIRLQLTGNQLEGTWEAEGCTPGRLALWNTEYGIRNAESVPPNSAFRIPYSALGKWSGHLSQSDREYGFYFEMDLAADGTGTSTIISDNEGGNATHQLRWTFDEAAGLLTFEETGISEKSVPGWRWCLKSGRLNFKREEIRLSLQGEWEGFIEGYSTQTGACAPGKLYVEKPVLQPVLAANQTAKETENLTLTYQPYEKNQGRDVQVERVLEVKSRNVRIKVWDNGTVDGDVLSLFLNGELLLKNYRVTRNKNTIPVKLEKPVNYIILHAINTGSISPNTVAVSVDDGVQEQIVIVSSNLKTSGAIMIREFVVK